MSVVIFEVRTPVLKRVTDCSREVIEKLQRREICSRDAHAINVALGNAMKAFGRKDLLAAEEYVTAAERNLASVDIDQEGGRMA